MSTVALLDSRKIAVALVQERKGHSVLESHLVVADPSLHDLRSTPAAKLVSSPAEFAVPGSGCAVAQWEIAQSLRRITPLWRTMVPGRSAGRTQGAQASTVHWVAQEETSALIPLLRRICG